MLVIQIASLISLAAVSWLAVTGLYDTYRRPTRRQFSRFPLLSDQEYNQLLDNRSRRHARLQKARARANTLLSLLHIPARAIKNRLPQIGRRVREEADGD